jgi:hypothetical protein
MSPPRRRSISLPAAIAAALALALAPARAHANCGAEGCPFAPEGPEASRGRISLDLGYQYIDQDRIWDGTRQISEADALLAEGGTGHVVEQETRTRAWLLNARTQLTDRVLLTVTWPWIDRIHRHALEHHPGFIIPSEWHIQGPGDATAMLHWRALGGGDPNAMALSGQLGIKLPTGQRHVDEVNGEEPEPPVRPGNGSTDGVAGLQLRRPVRMHALDGSVAGVPLTLTLLGRVNGHGSENYRSGNEWSLALAGGYALSRWAHLIAQVNAATHGADSPGSTDATAAHTGGTSVYASPGLRVEAMPGLVVYGYWQARIYQNTNGPQLVAPYHLSVGTSYAIGH